MSGVCKFCGCTEQAPCVVAVDLDGNRYSCGWIDEAMTLCTAPACVAKAYREARQRVIHEEAA